MSKQAVSIAATLLLMTVACAAEDADPPETVAWLTLSLPDQASDQDGDFRATLEATPDGKSLAVVIVNEGDVRRSLEIIMDAGCVRPDFNKIVHQRDRSIAAGDTVTVTTAPCVELDLTPGQLTSRVVAR